MLVLVCRLSLSLSSPPRPLLFSRSQMWSFGVVMFVMLFGYPPFHADADQEIFRQVLEGFQPIVKKGYKAHFPLAIACSDAAKDLIAKLLTSDTAKRLTADEALAHPWLTGEAAASTPMVLDVLTNLKNFSAHSKFKQDILNLMVNTLTEADLQKLKKLFTDIDTDGNGQRRLQLHALRGRRWRCESGGMLARSIDSASFFSLLLGHITIAELTAAVEKSNNVAAQFVGSGGEASPASPISKFTPQELQRILEAADMVRHLSTPAWGVLRDGELACSHVRFFLRSSSSFALSPLPRTATARCPTTSSC